VNHLSLLPLAGALILTASVAWSAEEKDGTKQSEPKPTSVEMKSISYDPKSVEVPVGGLIVWTNKAFTNHTATSEDDGKTFDTGEIKPGESSNPVKFDKEGEFTYHCKIHGKTMSGTVVVKPNAAN
jgi:plastocyanin